MSSKQEITKAYDLNYVKLKDFYWYFQTNWAMTEYYLEQGYTKEDLEYAYETEDVLLELYDSIIKYAS